MAKPHINIPIHANAPKNVSKNVFFIRSLAGLFLEVIIKRSDRKAQSIRYISILVYFIVPPYIHHIMNESHPDNKKKAAQSQPGGNSDDYPNNGTNRKDDLVLSGAAIIEDYVKRLPAKPGVYRMIGEKGDILYVGKAKDLSKRVVSYTNLRGHSNRIQRMITATRTMEFVITETETEALLLEANLIKTLKPLQCIIARR